MELKYHSICVFCGSSCGADPDFCIAARRTGELLAGQGVTLVYGAGRTGMMGALAQGAMAAGGKIIGVTHRMECEHADIMPGLAQVEIMGDLPQRKARMLALADAFIILPGGLGTMDELFEVLSWSQIGLQKKPIGILNLSGYFDGILAWFDRAASEQYITPKDCELFITDSNPEKLIKKLGIGKF
jgi:uncharacterized protein (TIGR00730 family)